MFNLAKWLNYVPAKEREGIALDRREWWWDVSGAYKVGPLVQAIGRLFPERAVLYVESPTMAPEVAEFLKARAPAKSTKVFMATIWPRPQVAHMTISAKHIAEFFALTEQQNGHQICEHLHVYQDEKVLLEGFDVLDSHPVSISAEISEGQVKTFAEQLKCTYKKSAGRKRASFEG